VKLSKVLSVEEVKGPYMHPNQRLIPIYKWYDTRDIQLTSLPRYFDCRGEDAGEDIVSLTFGISAVP